MRLICLACCANTARGPVTAVPPISVMNSRRRIVAPSLRGKEIVAVQPKFVKGRPMSALGQKQTFAPQKAMSALPPIATAKAEFRKRSCPLYPRKRTCAVRKQCLLWAKSGHGAKLSQATPLVSNTNVRPRQCSLHDRVDSWSGHCIDLTLKRNRQHLGSSLSVWPLEDGMDIPNQSRTDRYESFYREFDSP